MSSFSDDDVIIYCDPPYRNTANYKLEFDFNKFDEWAKNNDKTIFISEYDAPFNEINAIKKQSLMCGAKNQKTKLEKLFINKLDILPKKQMKFNF